MLLERGNHEPEYIKVRRRQFISYIEAKGERMLNEGLVGIVAGIITTWILFLGKEFWESSVVPYLQELRYQGVKVDGAWSGYTKVEGQVPVEGQVAVEAQVAVEGFESDTRLFLVQSAHKITGSFTFTFKNSKMNFTLDFNVSGYMWEGYITLNFLPKDRRITSYGTTLLKLHDGGLSLLGQWCFRDVEAEKVISIPMFLAREMK